MNDHKCDLQVDIPTPKSISTIDSPIFDNNDDQYLLSMYCFINKKFYHQIIL